MTLSPEDLTIEMQKDFDICKRSERHAQIQAINNFFDANRPFTVIGNYCNNANAEIVVDNHVDIGDRLFIAIRSKCGEFYTRMFDPRKAYAIRINSVQPITEG
jgi:hypothetical protein